MFESLKRKIKTRIDDKKRKLKKAVFLAFAAYIYDKISNKKKKNLDNGYIEDVEYKVEKKKRK